MDTESSLFTLDGVSLYRPDREGQVRPILQDVSLSIPDRTITCIIGPSGAGKSTLLRLLNRLEEPSHGSVAYRGQAVTAIAPTVLRRRVGLVLQTPVMLPGTVRQNLEAGLSLQGRSLPNPEEWLRRLGLSPGVLDRPAADLSGGEKQRVSLARTLVTESETLLLDEVTASLDPDSAAVVEGLVLQSGLPAVWVSHDPAQVRRVAGRILRVENGSVEEVAAL